MIPYHKYVVWKCRSCGKWQGHCNYKWTPCMSEYGKSKALSTLSLHCLRCNKHCKFLDKKMGGAVLHVWLAEPSRMSALVMRLEERERGIIREET